jgi:hypothetical protein
MTAVILVILACASCWALCMIGLALSGQMGW